MALTYVAPSSGTSSAGSFATSFPAGTTTGDVTYLALAGNFGANWPTPSGWTSIQSAGYSFNGSSNYFLNVFRRVIQGGDTAPTIDNSLTFGPSGWGYITLRGQNATPEDASAAVVATNSFGNSPVAPTVTTTQANDILLSVYGFDASVTGTPPGSGTERVDVFAGGSGGGLQINTEAIAAVGATGTRTETESGNTSWTAISVAVKGAPAASLTRNLFVNQAVQRRAVI